MKQGTIMGDSPELLKLEEMEIGEEFEPWEYTMTEDLVKNYQDSVDDKLPFYQNSPWGKIAPPGVMVNDWFRPSKQGKRFGGLHAVLRIEFINPARIGSRIKVQGKLVDKYETGIRTKSNFAVMEYICTDDAGLEIARIKSAALLR